MGIFSLFQIWNFYGYFFKYPKNPNWECGIFSCVEVAIKKRKNCSGQLEKNTLQFSDHNNFVSKRLNYIFATVVSFQTCLNSKVMLQLL